jgi:hypothetical protein
MSVITSKINSATSTVRAAFCLLIVAIPDRMTPRLDEREGKNEQSFIGTRCEKGSLPASVHPSRLTVAALELRSVWKQADKKTAVCAVFLRLT